MANRVWHVEVSDLLLILVAEVKGLSPKINLGRIDLNVIFAPVLDEGNAIMTRYPMTPEEFDRALRLVEADCPFLSSTSGHRSIQANNAANGDYDSKHLIGMARDYKAPAKELLEEGASSAFKHGLWWDIHDKGSGIHLHLQGLPTGPISEWWTQKFGN